MAEDRKQAQITQGAVRQAGRRHHDRSLLEEDLDRSPLDDYLEVGQVHVELAQGFEDPVLDLRLPLQPIQDQPQILAVLPEETVGQVGPLG